MTEKILHSGNNQLASAVYLSYRLFEQRADLQGLPACQEHHIRKSCEKEMRYTLIIARWAPFSAISIASLWASARTSYGYRDPIFDWDISWPAIANALTKLPHISSMFMIFLLGVLAVGVGRLWLAALLTFAVGIGWEVVQMPTNGNNPRLADLAPNLVGIGIGWMIVAFGALLWKRFRLVC